MLPKWRISSRHQLSIEAHPGMCTSCARKKSEMVEGGRRGDADRCRQWRGSVACCAKGSVSARPRSKRRGPLFAPMDPRLGDPLRDVNMHRTSTVFAHRCIKGNCKTSEAMMAIHIELVCFGEFATNPYFPRSLDISGVGMESDISVTKSRSTVILDIARGRLVVK